MGNSMLNFPDDTWLCFLEALSRRHVRYVLLAKIGVETGLRVSDILGLRKCDLKPVMLIHEGKTKKTKKCVLNPITFAMAGDYVKEYNLGPKDYLIFSVVYKKHRPLTRVQAYRVFKMAAEEAGLTERIGTHSMRKTYAKHLYKQTGGDIRAVQRALNHKHVETTIGYLLDIRSLVPMP
jgi:integrase